MAYQVTTKKSYGQRLSGSAKGIGRGLVMFLIGTVVLFWNEGRFVKTQKLLHEAEGVVVRVKDVSSADPALDGKLIHACAFANTSDVLTDGLFGINETAIAISREVAYFQYEEKSTSKKVDRIGGGQETVTTYTYEKKWVSQPINSGNFKDPEYQRSNFVLTTVEAKTERAENVTFGAYRLPSFIISSIGGSVPAAASLNADEIAQWHKTIYKTFHSPDTTKQFVHMSGNTVYFGLSPAAPEIGDVRITLTKTLPADISIIAKVVGNTFEEYIAANGLAFSAVAMGTVSAENMFAGAHTSNSRWTWILRIVGFFLVIGGLKSMFSILPALFKVLPFLGNIVGAGVGLVCTVGGGVWSLVIIAIAWLFYRPIVGIPLLVAAIAGIWWLKKKGKRN